MTKKSKFMAQFKKGAIPIQHVDEGSPLNQVEADPVMVRKRQGLSLGNQVQARPGMVGKQDRSHKKRK